MKKSWIIILIIIAIIIGILAGIGVYKNNKNQTSIIDNKSDDLSEKVTDECTEEWEYLQEQAGLELETNSSEEKISPNCSITLKRYYTECKHTINEYIDVPQNLVNKTKNELEEEFPNWEIQQFSSTQIILYREFESTCGQHYILRDDNGKITIYLINEEEQEEIYEKTEISVDYLTETDKIEIKNGIKVNGKEELNQLLEDFE